jgi:dolichyl-diphosphooligosaccharide--protein glycosyltransferase
MRLKTPPTAGWLDPEERPEYGVMASWSLGHVIEYVARRPTITDNFGDDIGEENFALAQRYFASAEDEAIAILERLGARYVVAQARRGFLEGDPDERSVYLALQLRDGSEREAGEAGEALPALTRHRLLYESRPLVRGGPEEPALFKVFERVAGATIHGRAAPGSEVRASVALRTNRERELRFATRARADAAGAYALRVPYATHGGPGSVEVADHYRLECGVQSAALAVEERAVAEGLGVEGPALCVAPVAR